MRQSQSDHHCNRWELFSNATFSSYTDKSDHEVHGKYGFKYTSIPDPYYRRASLSWKKTKGLKDLYLLTERVSLLIPTDPRKSSSVLGPSSRREYCFIGWSLYWTSVYPWQWIIQLLSNDSIGALGCGLKSRVTLRHKVSHAFQKNYDAIIIDLNGGVVG